MKSLIIYDSTFGNTAKIAKTITKALLPGAKSLQANHVDLSDLKGLDLLVVGSPTQGGRATSGLQKFLDKIPGNYLRGMRIAAFDTRFAVEGRGFGMRILLTIFDYAALKIASSLEKNGGHLIVPPKGFIVEGKEGPLKKGELKRAVIWAKKLRSQS